MNSKAVNGASKDSTEPQEFVSMNSKADNGASRDSTEPQEFVTMNSKADCGFDGPDNCKTNYSATDKQHHSTPNYPNVPFDIDKDITRSVLESCVRNIEKHYSLGRAHGVELVIDKKTAYYNASNLMPNGDKDVNDLIESDVMKLNFEYIESRLGKWPVYEVKGEANTSLNGVYMHALTIGNVLGHAVQLKCVTDSK